VLVHRLISLGTFEEKINAMMAAKRNWLSWWLPRAKAASASFPMRN
jgi:hypothetical protein